MFVRQEARVQTERTTYAYLVRLMEVGVDHNLRPEQVLWRKVIARREGKLTHYATSQNVLLVD